MGTPEARFPSANDEIVIHNCGGSASDGRSEDHVMNDTVDGILVNGPVTPTVPPSVQLAEQVSDPVVPTLPHLAAAANVSGVPEAQRPALVKEWTEFLRRKLRGGLDNAAAL